MTEIQPTALLTNDDGIQALGLRTLRHVLDAHGFRVIVIAPDRSHSCGGHGVSADRRIALTQYEARNSYACDGTPADCVRTGVLSGLFPRPDIVVSGINHGANAGDDIHYSGTVAAAVEAALLGIPALAVSQNADGSDVPFVAADPTSFPDAALAVELARSIVGRGLPSRTLISLNLPTAPVDRAPELARIGRRQWRHAQMRRLETASSDRIVLEPWASDAEPEWCEGTDFAFLREGSAAMSLLGVDAGLHDVLDDHRPAVEELRRDLTLGEPRRRALLRPVGAEAVG